MAPQRIDMTMHGLRLRSADAQAVTSDDPARVNLHPTRVRSIARTMPSGPAVLVDTTRWPTWLVANDDGWLLRYAGQFEFEIDADLAHIRPWADPSSDLDFTEVLLYGAVLATLLTLRGELCLHATTVVVDGTAVALSGSSGQGKTTTAALLVAAGATLLGDDVLMVGDTADGPVALPGALELRLRPTAVAVADLLAAERRITADDRLAVSLPGAAERWPDGAPLGGIVIPIPDRDHAEPRIETLGGSTALSAVLANLRMTGWCDAATVRRHFDRCADLADRVPVLALRVPWTEPFVAGCGDPVLELLRAHLRIPVPTPTLTR